MVRPPRFNSFNEMNASEWNQNLKDWPDECIRCKVSESQGKESIRQYAEKQHQELYNIRKDYLIIGGVLDNICNSACQHCNPHLSTKFGAIANNKISVDNTDKFYDFPQERILKLDINGGEPTASPNYKKLLEHPPQNVRYIRINTNGSLRIDPKPLLKRGIDVTITMSLDGIKKVHDYLRWPITWKTWLKQFNYYNKFKNDNFHLDVWSTISALNLQDYPNIKKFCEDKKVNWAWAFLESPDVLSVRHTNFLTEPAKDLFDIVGVEQDNSHKLSEWLLYQDTIRKINYKDYL
jgi:sulfatase maturation enzyme AslB (radical SAM superfamily)